MKNKETVKNLVAIQSALLAVAVVLGALIKIGVLSDVTIFHKSAGIAAFIVGIITVIHVFRHKYATKIKTLAVLTVLFTLSAAIGGASLEKYNFAYMQMAVSGFLAAITSIALWFKTHKLHKKK